LDPAVVVFILDGCRPDYLTRIKTETIDMMMREGAVVEECRTVFPTLTGAAHTTLTTGLYPITHGVTSGFRFDSDCGKLRQLWMSDYAGRSIGELSAQHGLVTGSVEEFSLFTRGANLYVHVPSHKVEEVRRFAKQVIETKRPEVLFVTFFAVDDAGHIHGPDSRRVDEAVKSVDHAIGDLVHLIERSHKNRHALFVLTSDHGMVSVKRSVSTKLERRIRDASGQAHFRFLGRFAQVFSRSPTSRQEIVKSTVLDRAVDVVLEAAELVAMGTSDGRGNEILMSLAPNYSCLTGASRKLHGYHGGLDDLETRVPLIFFGRHVRPSRLLFAETVDVTPTLAEYLGLRPERFEGSSLLKVLVEGPGTDGSTDVWRELREIYKKRTQIVRDLTELKRTWAHGDIGDRRHTQERARIIGQLPALVGRSQRVRRGIARLPSN